MIRIVTIDPMEEADITALCSRLFQAFGLGTEHAGDVEMPKEAERADGKFDAKVLIEEADTVRTFADDKILYVTQQPLGLPAGPLGEPPCWGYADYGKQRAVMTLAKIPARGTSEASIEAFQKRVGREAVHVIGHVWQLHHCYDPRCPMHPSWSPLLASPPEADLCNFCRDKSEKKIRLGKS